MLGLKVYDKVLWHDRWSSEIGRHLQIMDSTDDFYVFAAQHRREEILDLLREAPEDIYGIFEIEETVEGLCDFQADSGRCYNHK